jgi:hypothetical protein
MEHQIQKIHEAHEVIQRMENWSNIEDEYTSDMVGMISRRLVRNGIWTMITYGKVNTSTFSLLTLLRHMKRISSRKDMS